MLSPEDKKLLEKNRPQLMDHINLEGGALFAELRARDVISGQQEQIIKCEKGQNVQVGKLLDVLLRGDVDTVDMLVYALRASGQSRVAAANLREPTIEDVVKPNSRPHMEPGPDTSVDCNNTDVGEIYGEIWNKSRPLQISVVNKDPKNQLLMVNSYFDTGKFWQPPVYAIGPRTSMTFFVCNKDLAFYTGVSGGCSFGVYPVGDKPGVDQPQKMFICCFSNPLVGSTKGLCEVKNSADHGKECIRSVWGRMDTGDFIRGPQCEFYIGIRPGETDTEHGDKKLVFVWKTPETPW